MEDRFANQSGGASAVEWLQEFIESFNVVCPVCRGDVALKNDGEAIKCLSCGRVYPVRDRIPSLVAEDASVEDEGSAKSS